jgi:hypothetical protein
MPTLQRVPLLPFLTTPAVYSAPTAVGLLHPTADHEVRPVSGRLPTIADNTTLLTDANTLRSFSLETRWKPVTQEHSLTKQKPKPLPFHEHPQFTEVPTPLDVPDDASTHTEVHPSSSTSRPQGGDHASSPLSRGRVATTLRPDAPLGFHSTSGLRLDPAEQQSRRSNLTTDTRTTSAHTEVPTKWPAPSRLPHHTPHEVAGVSEETLPAPSSCLPKQAVRPERRNPRYRRPPDLPEPLGATTRDASLRTGGLPKTVPPCEQDDHPAEGSAEAKPLPPARPPSTSCPCDQET